MITPNRDYYCLVCNKISGIKKIDNRRTYQFCSSICYRIYRKTKKPIPNCICRECGKKFYRKLSAIKNGEGKFCSRICKHSNQRQGIETRGESYNQRHLIRQSSQYKGWRLKAKQLRGNKCEKCGIKDRSICTCCGNRIFLHVNHVKPFATYTELRFDPQNASVLCPKCHLGL